MARRRGKKRAKVSPPPPPEEEKVSLESAAWLREDVLKTFLLTALIIGIELAIYWLGLASA
jgi:hypothetical protein